MTGPIEPVVVDEGWENAHDAILGADNKAAVAVLLEVARRASVEGAPVGLELLFTVSEEDALAGAKAFDTAALRAEVRLRLRPRLADRRGDRRLADLLPAHRRVPRPRGARRHPPRARAQRDPRRRARRAAMPHGRLDEQTTANVGSIRGGVGSTNVVPERCTLMAEARSLDPNASSRSSPR